MLQAVGRVPAVCNRSKENLMTTLRSSVFALILALATTLGLTACGGDTSTKQAMVSMTDAQARSDEARIDGKAEEAKLADAKLVAAKTGIEKLAYDTARAGQFTKKANCDVMPDGFSGTAAVRSFPSNAQSMYRDACHREVNRLVAERKADVSRAIAKAKHAETARKVTKAVAPQIKNVSYKTTKKG